MAETKRKKYTRYTSPVVTFQFPYLITPDTKFNADGDYKVKGSIEGALGEKLAQILDAEYEKAVTQMKEENPSAVKKGKIKLADKPYTQNEETGAYEFNFKRTALIKPKDKSKDPIKVTIPIFDRFGKPLAKDAKIGGGTKGKITFEVVPFFTALVGAGITLRLVAAQVIELVEWGGGDAASYGFDAEEDDTEQESGAEQAPAEEKGSEDGGSEDEF